MAGRQFAIEHFESPVDVKDLQALAALDRRLIAESGRTYSEESWLVAHFQMELPGKWRFSRAARNLSGTLVGFWIASVRSPATLHTHRVGVAPEYRNAGVGRRLFQEVLREAELADLSVMTLLVSEEATGAIGFYRQLGFERQRDRDTGSLRPRDSARDSGTVVGNLTSIADGLRILLWRRVK